MSMSFPIGTRYETGQYVLLDYVGYVDVGTILHPRNLGGQILDPSMLGIGHAIGQKWVYDQHYGVALAKRFYQNKPPTILDAPRRMQWGALDIPDPGTPVGAKGIGEPPVAAGCCAVLNAPESQKASSFRSVCRAFGNSPGTGFKFFNRSLGKVGVASFELRAPGRPLQ